MKLQIAIIVCCGLLGCAEQAPITHRPKATLGSAYPPLSTIGVTGDQFAAAIDQRFQGAVPTSVAPINATFATLPPELDGQSLYCKDCQATVPCAGGGTGALAIGVGGQWACSSATIPTIVPRVHCDGVTDDSSIINAAITSAPVGSVITLPSGKNCAIASGLNFTTAVGFDGNGSKLTSSMTTSGSAAITISSVVNGANYAGNRVPYRHISLVGPGSSSVNWAGYNLGTTGILLKASNISIESPNITGYNNGILYGNNAYMVSVFDPQIYANYYGVLFPFVPLSDAGENLNFTGGSVFNNTRGFEDDGGSASEFHFDATSFDYNGTQIIPNGADTFDHIHLEGITAVPFQMSGGYNNYTHLWVTNSNIVFGSSPNSSSIPLISITGTGGEYALFDRIFLSGFQQSNSSGNFITGAGAANVTVCHATDTFLSATAFNNLGPFGSC